MLRPRMQNVIAKELGYSDKKASWETAGFQINYLFLS
jgi:hypothetical protein